MSKSLTFTSLDFNLVKPYLKSVLLLIAMGVVMGIGFKSTAILYSYYMMTLVILMTYPFSVGEKNGLDILYGTLSINKKNIVTGRYLFVLTMGTAFLLLSLICSLVMAAVLETAFIPENEFIALSLLFCACSLIIALQYPVYFKFGYTKGRIIAFFPLFILFFAGIQAPTLAKALNIEFSWLNWLEPFAENPLFMCGVPVAFGIVCLALSCLVSLKLYAKRDL